MTNPKVCTCRKPPIILKIYTPFENENMKYDEVHYDVKCCRKVSGDTADIAVENWNRR